MGGDEQDRLYAEGLPIVEDFVFDDAVTRVFPDMIGRSVPGYRTLVEMIGVIGRRWMRPDTRCYDLGCSLGAAAYAVAARGDCPGAEIVAVDSSQSMIARLRERLASDPPGMPLRPVCADVREVSMAQASLVILNLTLQFIPPRQRLALLRRIHAGLLPGGVLILTEKVRLDGAGPQACIDDLHRAYKRAMGYSDLEISQKRAALERVLIPEGPAVHRRRLRECGFADVTVWFQCLGFMSMLAFKAPRAVARDGI